MALIMMEIIHSAATLTSPLRDQLMDTVVPYSYLVVSDAAKVIGNGEIVEVAQRQGDETDHPLAPAPPQPG